MFEFLKRNKIKQSAKYRNGYAGAYKYNNMYGNKHTALTLKILEASRHNDAYDRGFIAGCKEILGNNKTDQKQD